ncbi:MAG: hypothetical protein LBD79_01290 [Treponema sp.]|jgi:hypothetical protein|nr:hypothetical protein [Treponema sp.]
MSGKGGNRRNFKRREQDDAWQEKSSRKGMNNSRRETDRHYTERGMERFRWIPPAQPSEPLPTPDCPYCGKPIKDIATALEDPTMNMPAHFECVMAFIAEDERLEKEDILTYIGGGRFGIVRFTGISHRFRIKKIMEWENRENRAEWRKTISEYYSST